MSNKVSLLFLYRKPVLRGLTTLLWHRGAGGDWSSFFSPQPAPLPASPVRFSPAILALLDKFYPSDLDCAGAERPVPAWNKTSRHSTVQHSTTHVC
ncbi:hypothetical protein OJAV_G00050110 [Oryzias javanicus]|uniref:Uncharacterized protein n=1 Tax=Oryzias javanicus TaxID=123683 RepID=A0A437D7W4_ORYJA|nr:hypothetical protein OJAV_G00050110 [Oryzias javanicus]